MSATHTTAFEASLNAALVRQQLVEFFQQTGNRIGAILTARPQTPQSLNPSGWTLLESMRTSMAKELALIQTALNNEPRQPSTRLDNLRLRLQSKHPLIHEWLQNLTPSKEKIGLRQGDWLPSRRLQVQWHLHASAAPQLAQQRDLVLTFQLPEVKATFSFGPSSDPPGRITWERTSTPEAAGEPITDLLSLTLRHYPEMDTFVTHLSHLVLRSVDTPTAHQLMLDLG